MNKTDYHSLIRQGMIDNSFGQIKYYSSGTPYKYTDIVEILKPQLTCKIDIRNIIILFPTQTSYGTNWLFSVEANDHKNKFPIDHAVNVINVKYFLKEQNINFKNNIKATDERFIQKFCTMLIIQDGVAYVNDFTANPFSSMLDYSLYTQKEITINSEDLKHLNFQNKEIVFSGFLLKRIQENTL